VSKVEWSQTLGLLKEAGLKGVLVMKFVVFGLAGKNNLCKMMCNHFTFEVKA